MTHEERQKMIDVLVQAGVDANIDDAEDFIRHVLIEGSVGYNGLDDKQIQAEYDELLEAQGLED